MRPTLKEGIIYLLIFILIYFEQTSFGPIKISYWKLPIIIYMLTFVLKHYKVGKEIFVLSIIISLKLIFNLYFYLGVETFNEATYIIILPLSLNFFYIKYKFNSKKAVRLLILTASFFLLSALPFIFNLLSQTRSISIYEGQENLNALTGIFYHMSISSQIFSVSTIIILFNYNYFSCKKIKHLWFVLIFLGIYCVYAAYTRTGWIMLLIGFIYFSKFKLDFLRYKILYITSLLSLLIVIPLIFSELDKESFFYKRLVGESTNTTNDDLDLNTLSSGRLLIYQHSLQGVFEEGNLGILLGIGKDLSTTKNNKIHGVGYVAHNKFIEVFCYGGILALLIFFFYLYSLYKTIAKIRYNNPFKKLIKCLFILMIFTLIPSHGFNMYSDFLFGLLMAIAFINNRPLQTVTKHKYHYV